MERTNEELAQYLVGFASTRDASEMQKEILLRAAARLRQQSEDSARYQWLRDQIRFGKLVIATVSDLDGLTSWSGDDPDSAIDKARKA